MLEIGAGIGIGTFSGLPPDAGGESFNLLAVPGRLVAGRTSAVGISPGTLRVYEALAPFWRPVERLLRRDSA